MVSDFCTILYFFTISHLIFPLTFFLLFRLILRLLVFFFFLRLFLLFLFSSFFLFAFLFSSFCSFFFILSHSLLPSLAVESTLTVEYFLPSYFRGIPLLLNDFRLNFQTFQHELQKRATMLTKICYLFCLCLGELASDLIHLSYLSQTAPSTPEIM